MQSHKFPELWHSNIVNLSIVKAQLTGAIVYAVAATVYGQIRLQAGQIQQPNFKIHYDWRKNEMPQFGAYFLSSGRRYPRERGGEGEPGTPPLAPAIADVVFAGTGQRMRSPARKSPDQARSQYIRSGEMPTTTFVINGRKVEVDAAGDTPLLWIIREQLKLTGTKFGCGIAQCGACTVHVEGNAVRSCQMPLEDVAEKNVTTIEGLSANGDHPLQIAWIAEQVPQCGYCQSGQIMQAAAILTWSPRPTRQQIIDGMDGNICRCGTYPRILRAIERALKGI